MINAAHRAIDQVLAHPVGEERSSFGLGSAAPRAAALLLRPALSAGEAGVVVAARVGEVVEHLVRWIEDNLDVAESRRTASDALALLADRLARDVRAAAFPRVIGVHDDPPLEPVRPLYP